MRPTFALALLSLAASVQSLVLPRNPCYKCQGFTISVSGGVSGPLGQISDGQNRVGPKTPTPAKYNLGCNGGIVDAKGRGCILTPPTTQYQCDEGASPTTGFAIGSNGGITYNGKGEFWACPVDDYGNWNIYSKPVAGQTKCVKVWLTAKGCSAPPPPPPPPPPKSCPYSLVYPNGQSFEFPHLIVPVDKKNPNKAYGTSYFGEITSSKATIFNFDVRPGFKGKKCSLVWLFPTNPPSDTSSYTFSGAGNLHFWKKSSPATQGTTYNNQGGNSVDYGVTKVVPGHSYTISTFDCPYGQKIAFEISSTDTNLRYFQDYNPSAVGLYITVC
ncbi:hypothetical protein TWF225_009928 [Orbilia oligospora]|uniref:Uncharacterized protein n=1 Tax=Orbilia oligospora TaxID=2813651 RepID=A0A7C8P389_ORBOL|nr:hypothetical protein TWF751_001604 [Orbilia oligospora]KAF3172949.1 hypothetical protein TWF225_009928 [Orbilia oligospora]KAF3237397.1 hypothetical protein TWF217_002122 [Orbilia oligospora]KAF3240314.1 hypothetical protein TWF128_011337 [Orbilia oligospora]KAF3283497.1 hypothetical protein TWF132_010303 [Orbilia oligospora]